MSGLLDTTGQQQSSEITPASAAPGVSPPENPSTSAAASGGSNTDMLTQDKFSRSVIVLGATITVCLSILAAVAAMVYRVVIDGNNPITNDITSKLCIIALVGVASLVAALFGSNNVLAKVLEKL